jgi:hypothetical protein
LGTINIFDLQKNILEVFMKYAKNLSHLYKNLFKIEIIKYQSQNCHIVSSINNVVQRYKEPFFIVECRRTYVYDKIVLIGEQFRHK